MDSQTVGTERSRLEAIAFSSAYAKGVNAQTIIHAGRVFERHFCGRSCLELGPAEGLMTETLVRNFPELTLIDGSERFCAQLKNRFPRASIVCSLFEEFQPAHRFDAIVMGHVLEHVLDPGGLLSAVRGWLNPNGRVYASVPNANSLHRQAAVLMGLLPSVYAFSDSDRRNGHRRVYDAGKLRTEFSRVGLAVEVAGGYWLKPLSDRQIEATWTEDMVNAFMNLGERNPDIAAELYVIASA